MKAILLIGAVIMLGAAAQQPFNWGDERDYGDEASKQVCRSVKGTPFPAGDRPAPAQIAALKGCDPEALYYGMGMPADPLKARQCAYAIMGSEADQSFYSARAVLMTIYANGKGASRNIDLATHLACTEEGAAPAEYEGRIEHLQAMKKAGAAAETDFDLCDDITSGMSMGFCASHDQDVQQIRRAAEYRQITAPWTPAQRSAFATLEKARDAYLESRSQNEVDVSGTGRVTFIIDAEEGVAESFFKRLKVLEGGRGAGARNLAAADRELNVAYRKVMASDEADYGTVKTSGIRETQRVWLRYRDAWLAFAKVKYPNVPQDALSAWLTEERTELLKEFVSE